MRNSLPQHRLRPFVLSVRYIWISLLVSSICLQGWLHYFSSFRHQYVIATLRPSPFSVYEKMHSPLNCTALWSRALSTGQDWSKRTARDDAYHSSSARRYTADGTFYRADVYERVTPSFRIACLCRVAAGGKYNGNSASFRGTLTQLWQPFRRECHSYHSL